MQNNKLLSGLISVLLIIASIYLGVLIRNSLKNYDYIGVTAEQKHSISVSGQGKAIGTPDVALINFGYNTEKKTVAEAQDDNTKVMNNFTAKLKNTFNIEAKDIQTSNYNIYPAYNWTNNKQILRGYEVRQEITVKVRELAKVSPILALAGEANLNQVGGLSFKIDNTEELEKQARTEALTKAKQKAEELAQITGIKLGKIISFGEYNNTPSPYPMYKTLGAEMVGYGGGSDSAPQIEAGNAEVIINATVEYEIL